jgi:hypothetical protein
LTPRSNAAQGRSDDNPRSKPKKSSLCVAVAITVTAALLSAGFVMADQPNNTIVSVAEVPPLAMMSVAADTPGEALMSMPEDVYSKCGFDSDCPHGKCKSGKCDKSPY